MRPRVGSASAASCPKTGEAARIILLSGYNDDLRAAQGPVGHLGSSGLWNRHFLVGVLRWDACRKEERNHQADNGKQATGEENGVEAS